MNKPEQTWTNHETVSYKQLPQRDECPYQSRDDHALQLQRLDPELSTRPGFLETLDGTTSICLESSTVALAEEPSSC